MSDLCLPLAALGHPQRMVVWRHLQAQNGVPVAAGVLSDRLGIKPSTLSVYLRKLVEGGLVEMRIQGPSRLYALRVGAIEDVSAQLGVASAPGHIDLPIRVGFVCRDGGARSRFAAALLNRVGRPRFSAASSGLCPPRRDPLVDQILATKGHDTARLKKAEAPDMIIRLTRAPGPLEATLPGATPVVHWRVPDPAAGEAGVVAGLSRLGQLYRNLAGLVADLANVPVETSTEAEVLAAVQGIGQLSFDRRASPKREDQPV